MINVPIIQVTFMYPLKISAIKNIKLGITTTAKITDRYAGIQMC